MTSYRCDIFKVFPDGGARWLETAADFASAKLRVQILGQETPGDFLIHDGSKKFLFSSGRNGAGLLQLTHDLHDPLRISMEKMLDEAIELAQADFGNVQLLDSFDNSLRLVVQRGFSQSFLSFFRLVRVDDSCACGVALRERRRIIVNDVSRDPIFADQLVLAHMLADNAHSVQSMPLVAGGKLIGMLSVHYRLSGIAMKSQRAISDNFLTSAAGAIQAGLGKAVAVTS